MEENDKKQVEQMIQDALKKPSAFPERKLGDTPTDSFQLTPKGYVDRGISSVFSSIRAGFTINGNLVVTGSASIAGNLKTGSLDTGALNAASASIATTLKVGSNASIGGILYVDNQINGGTILLRGVSVPNVYSGAVSSGGNAGTPFPVGWTSSFIGTGSYSIIHNFGTIVYAINATANTFVATINARNNNDFNIITLSSAGSPQNDAFEFSVVKP